MSSPFVAMLMGSKSDLEAMRAGAEVLDKFGIRHEIKISSAHRTPEATREYVEAAVERGCQVFIAGAGLAAHLAGAIAAHTTKPVIGVPMDAGPLNGFDALLATVQMPAGVPVASVAIGRTGAKMRRISQPRSWPLRMLILPGASLPIARPMRSGCRPRPGIAPGIAGTVMSPRPTEAGSGTESSSALAAQCLRRGGVIACPTEAVWGLGCDPFNHSAVLRVLALKQRPVEKGLLLVAAGMEQIEGLLAPLSQDQLAVLRQSWPGHVTWLIPDPDRRYPDWIRGEHASVAVRVSDHPVVSSICRAFGKPMVSTSANLPASRKSAHSLTCSGNSASGSTAWSMASLAPTTPHPKSAIC